MNSVRVDEGLWLMSPASPRWRSASPTKITYEGCDDATSALGKSRTRQRNSLFHRRCPGRERRDACQPLSARPCDSLLDEPDHSCGSRARNPNGAADAERMKMNPCPRAQADPLEAPLRRRAAVVRVDQRAVGRLIANAEGKLISEPRALILQTVHLGVDPVEF